MAKIKTIKVGSRASALALVQTEEVHALLSKTVSGVTFDTKTYKTKGDKDKKTSLTSKKIPDDFFTDQVDKAVLKGDVDIAVHSAKDLPKTLAEGLSIYALTKSLDDTDAFVGKSKLNRLKSGAKIGTSSTLRKESFRELYPKLKTVEIRGTIDERLKLVENGTCDGIIVATIALKRLGLKKLIKDIFPWEGFPLQGQLAVVGREDNTELQKLFSKIDVRKNYGKVTLVGAGPGDPELLTVKGANALKTADCVFYDYLISEELLNYAPLTEKIYVGKRKGKHSLKQTDLNRMLRDKALDGKNVVRLKGGDPLIFGRGGDEIAYLCDYHIGVDVVPGITSATGLLSSLGIPLTSRGISSSVSFVSGHDEKGKSSDAIKIPKTDTIIFFMGLTKLDVILKSLKKAGWHENQPIMIISRGTKIDEHILTGTVKTIKSIVKKEDVKPPALIIAGETTSFWKPKPEHKNTVLYLGSSPERHTSLGRLVHFPMIDIKDKSFTKQDVKKILLNLKSCDLLLFTSQFGVKYFFELLIKANYSLSDLKIDTAAIGQATKRALSYYDIIPTVTAKMETSQGMFEALKKEYNVKNKKILFPRSSLPNPFLKTELTKLGCKVNELVIYNNSKPKKRALPKKGITHVFFTSPSTVRNFLKDYGKIPVSWKIISRGTRTAAELIRAGYDKESITYE